MGLAPLLECLAQRFGRSPETVGRWATGSGTFYRRLAAGARVRAPLERRVLRWCADRWPEDLAWPANLPRPTPDPAALWTQPSPAPIAIAAAATARECAKGAPSGSDAHRGAMGQALRIGKRLDPTTGQVACPDALCAALGVSRAVYDSAVARYATHRRRTAPRESSAARRMLAALRDAGDVRFQPPTPPPELAGKVAHLPRQLNAASPDTPDVPMSHSARPVRRTPRRPAIV